MSTPPSTPDGRYIWTTANLVPRAISHHRWYREKFSDYPKDRKAVVPLILAAWLLVALGCRGN